MKVGATAEIIAPYYSSIRAWQDPTHLRAISENTFLYFNKDWRMFNKLDHYPIVSDFDFESKYIIDPAWRDKSGDELKFAIRHYSNVVSDIITILKKRKPHNAEAESLSQQASECWEAGRFGEAAGFCDQLVERGEAGSDEYLMIADYAFKNNEFKPAIDAFRKALEHDADSFSAHVGLVRSLNRVGQKKDVQKHLAGIKKSDPELAHLITDLIANEAVSADSKTDYAESE